MRLSNTETASRWRFVISMPQLEAAVITSAARLAVGRSVARTAAELQSLDDSATAPRDDNQASPSDRQNPSIAAARRRGLEHEPLGGRSPLDEHLLRPPGVQARHPRANAARPGRPAPDRSSGRRRRPSDHRDADAWVSGAPGSVVHPDLGAPGPAAGCRRPHGPSPRPYRDTHQAGIPAPPVPARASPPVLHDDSDSGSGLGRSCAFSRGGPQLRRSAEKDLAGPGDSGGSTEQAGPRLFAGVPPGLRTHPPVAPAAPEYC